MPKCSYCSFYFHRKRGIDPSGLVLKPKLFACFFSVKLLMKLRFWNSGWYLQLTPKHKHTDLWFTVYTTQFSGMSSRNFMALLSASRSVISGLSGRTCTWIEKKSGSLLNCDRIWSSVKLVIHEHPTVYLQGWVSVPTSPYLLESCNCFTVDSMKYC